MSFTASATRTGDGRRHEDNEAVPRRFDTTLHLPGGLTPDQVSRLQRVARSCPVSRALETGFAFEEQTVFAAPTLA